MVEPSGALQSVFDRAVKLSKSYTHEYVTLEHMLFAMCEDQKFYDVLKGYGTDVDSLKSHLITYLDNKLDGIKVKVAKYKPKKTISVERVLNRTLKKSEQIVRDLNIEMQIENFESINKLVSGCDLIVNTTPLGMTGHKNIEIDFVNSKPNLHVYDLVYNPIETKLLKDAKDNNKTCQNGLDMLVYQAAESFKIWHGIYPNINNDLFSILRRDK